MKCIENKKILIIIIISSIILITGIILLIYFLTKSNEKDNREYKDINQFDFQNKNVVLNNGYKMPIIGLGTWTLTGETVENSVYFAIKNGYRLIDTAKMYNNERNVGNGIKKAINEGIIKREELFVTTKLVPYSSNDYYKEIENCIERLDIGYVDLMLIHQKGSDEKKLYSAIEKAISNGIVKSLGISNYYKKSDFDDITKSANILPVVIQNENHIFYNDIEFQKYVGQYGIIIESYYPLGGRGHTNISLNNQIIVDIAKKYNKSSAQIILRWHIQRGFIAIPGSKSENHILENIDIFNFELTDDEMSKINNLNSGKRYESW